MGHLTEEPFEYGGKDPEGGVYILAVDEDRHHACRCLFQLCKDPPDAGGLSGPWRAAEVDVDGACAVQGRAECRGELPELRVAVVDGFWCIIEFKDIIVADECLVVHEIVVHHDEGLGCDVILIGRAWGESEVSRY